MAEKVKCPRCGSLRIWKKGKVPMLGGIKKPRYVCYDCGTTFYAPEAGAKTARARKPKSGKKKAG